MSKKLIYIFVILVAGLFIISACEQAVGVRARQLDRGGADNIKANSCDADNSCEVNSLLLSSNSYEGDKPTIKAEGNGIILNKKTVIQGYLSADEIILNKIFLSSNSYEGEQPTIEASGNGIILNKKVIIEGYVDAHEILSSSLIGKGNAYACINSQGKLFRSNNPCR